MANLNLLESSASNGTNVSTGAKRRLCSYCQKTFHRNSLIRHQKICVNKGLGTAPSHGEEDRETSAENGPDAGKPPKLHLITDFHDDSALENTENGFLSDDFYSGPPKLQSVIDLHSQLKKVCHKGGKSAKDGSRPSRKSKVGSTNRESHIRRVSLDQLGISDTPSDHSESSDTIEIRKSDTCAIVGSHLQSLRSSSRTDAHLKSTKGSSTPTSSPLKRSSSTKSPTTQSTKKLRQDPPLLPPPPPLSIEPSEEKMCQKCGQVFASLTELSTHGFKYIQSGILVCLLCSNKQVENLDEHLRSEHQSEKKKIPCELCTKGIDRNNYFHHLKEHHTAVKKFKCDSCSMEFSFLQNLLYHKGTDHLKEMHNSKYCQRNGDMMKVLTDKSDDKSSGRYKRYGPSPALARKSNLSSNKNDDGGSDSFGKPSGANALSQSGSSCSSSVTQVPAVATEEEKVEQVRATPPAPRSNGHRFNGSNQECSNRVPENSSVVSEIPSEDPSSVSRVKAEDIFKTNMKAPTLEDVEKKYLCQLCEQKFETRFTYLDHLRNDHHWPRDHRLNPEYEPQVWCPECGQEFVVRPTLLKHLMVVHDDISAPAAYMEAVGYGSRPLLPHQCSVCFNLFDSDGDLSSHLRCHGLAYLEYISKNSSKY